MKNNLISLDVGEKRIGVALASYAGFPSPLITLINDDGLWEKLNTLISNNEVGLLVVGLPRSLSGNDTLQTAYTQVFIRRLQDHVDIPVVTQDEALTSKRAEEELRSRNPNYNKSEIDSLAATYILEDYINEHKGQANEG